MGETSISINLSRGRPKDYNVRNNILEVINETEIPLNVDTVRRLVSEKMNKKNLTWRTVDKHIKDLEQERLIERHIINNFKTKRTQLITKVGFKMA